MNKHLFYKFLISFIMIFSIFSYASETSITSEEFLKQHSNQARLSREWGGKFLGTTGAIWLGSSVFLEKEAVPLQILGGIYTTVGVLTFISKTDIEKKYEETRFGSEESRLNAIHDIQKSQKIARYILGGVIAFPALFAQDSAKATLGALALPFFLFKTPIENECSDFLDRKNTQQVTIEPFLLPKTAGVIVSKRF